MKNNASMNFVVLILVGALATSGCSTVFGRHQDEQMVTFDSNVQGVDILCSGKRAETPGNIPLKQSKSHSCTAKKEGYEKKAFRIRSGTSWSGFGHSTAVNTAIWGWWTFGVGTAFGWLVDWPSGAMRNLKDDNVFVEMRPIGSTETASLADSAEKAIDRGATDAVTGTAPSVLPNAAKSSLNTVKPSGSKVI